MTLHNPVVCIAAALTLFTVGCTGPGRVARDESTESTIASKFAQLPVADIVAAGDRAMQEGDAERARFIYLQALAVEESADIWLRVGRANLRVNRKAEAWQAFAAVIKLEPENVAAHEELGLLYLSTKQRESARASLEHAVSLDPTRWRAQNALGVLADAEGNYDAAIGYYSAALEHRPDSALLLNNLGYSHYLAGHYQLAEKHFRMAIGINGGYTKAIANLGLVQARTGAYASAVETLSQVLAEHEAFNDVGYVAFRNSDFDDAMWLLTRATELSPTYYVTAHDNLEHLRKAMTSGEKPAPDDPADNIAALQPVDSPDAEQSSAEVPAQATLTKSYRRAVRGPLDVYSAGNFDAKVIGQLEKGERVIQLFANDGWSFIAFGDIESTQPPTGWVRSGSLSDDRVANLD